MNKPTFKPLPDVKTVMAGLRRMANDTGNNDRLYGKGFYTIKAIIRDYPEQFKREDMLALPPVNVVRVPVIKPKTIYEPQKTPTQAKRTVPIERM